MARKGEKIKAAQSVTDYRHNQVKRISVTKLESSPTSNTRKREINDGVTAFQIVKKELQEPGYSDL